MSHQSLEQLRRDLEQAKQTAMFLRVDLPDLNRLRAGVQHWTTESVIDPDNKHALEAASNELKQAVIRHAESQAANRKVDELQAQVGHLEHEQRMRRIELANNALGIANAAYLEAGKALIRAYRRLLEQQQISQRTPGAQTAIAGGFHVEALMPSGWDGSMSDAMRAGLLPFENNERALAAELVREAA